MKKKKSETTPVLSKSGPISAEQMHELEKSINETMEPFALEADKKAQNSELKAGMHWIG
ncbi:MAG: hypothetical protein WC264_00865 [Candidatus Paceibacterota bacterium]|jgi:hypothetical protein